MPAITPEKSGAPEADRAEVEREIEAAKKVLEQHKESRDAAAATALKESEEKLKKALYKIGEMMYRSAQGAQGAPGADPTQEAPPSGGARGGKKDDGVIDAEFTEEPK